MANPHHHLAPDVRWGLKAATRDLIRRCGGARRAEAITGVSDTHLSRCGDPDSDSVIGLAAVVLLEADAGRPAVTEFMAGLSGFRLVPVDSPSAQPETMPSAFAEVVAETGDLLETTSAALVDGSVSENEARGIATDASQARDAIDDLTRTVACTDLRLVPRHGGR